MSGEILPWVPPDQHFSRKFQHQPIVSFILRENFSSRRAPTFLDRAKTMQETHLCKLKIDAKIRGISIVHHGAPAVRPWSAGLENWRL